MIEVFAAASIGGIVGFFTCATLTAGKAADEFTRQTLLVEARREADFQRGLAEMNGEAVRVNQARIERALDCVTENSAHVGKKMAAILKGERL